jgi:hypothetical protein
MMENIQHVIKWFSDPNNIQNILAVLGAVYTIALFIVKITPSKADDEWLAKAYAFVHSMIGKLGVKK